MPRANPAFQHLIAPNGWKDWQVTEVTFEARLPWPRNSSASSARGLQRTWPLIMPGVRKRYSGQLGRYGPFPFVWIRISQPGPSSQAACPPSAANLRWWIELHGCNLPVFHSMTSLLLQPLLSPV